MAGARGRKLDLSGYLAGNANVANILANTDRSGGIGGLLGGFASGITRAGANLREDKRRREVDAEQASDRAFRQNLALRADARAEADQRIQEEEEKRKVAADAKVVEETAHLISRAKASVGTGMPMDPKVVEEIQKRAGAIQASGGPAAIMARAAAQEEPDIEGLIAETGRLEKLTSLITAQMGREKDPVRHAALGDSLMQLGSIVDVNKYRIRLHGANTARKEKAAAEREAKFTEARDALEAMGEFGREVVPGDGGLPEVGEWGREPVNLTDANAMLARRKAEEGSQRRVETKAESAAAEDARLRATYKARTGKDAPEGVDVKALRTWEVQDERARAVAEDRAASADLRKQAMAETERHHRATEQLSAIGKNPNKDRMKSLLDSANRHLANAKEYADYNSAVGDTTKAKAEMEAAQAALNEFDGLARESGAAGTAPEYPSWLPAAGRGDWDRLSAEAKAEVLRKRGQ